MKRIRDYFILVAIAVISVFTLTACGDDDDEPTAGDLKGLWESVRSIGWEKINGVTGESWDETDTSTRIEFKSDGSFSIMFFEDGEWDNGEFGTWSLKDNILILTTPWGDLSKSTVKYLDNKKMMIEAHYTEIDEDDGLSYEYYEEMTYRKI